MRSSHLLLSTLAAFALATGSAHAADLPATEAEAVADELGSKAAGTYYDAASDEMVVNVTDQNAAKKVRAAGGIAKLVEHSGAELEQVKATIDTAANVPGMAWAIDPVENKVVVTVDETVDAAELQHVEAGVARRRRRGPHRARRRDVYAADPRRRRDPHRRSAAARSASTSATPRAPSSS